MRRDAKKARIKTDIALFYVKEKNSWKSESYGIVDGLATV
jgi:hypothetical protein